MDSASRPMSWSARPDLSRSPCLFRAFERLLHPYPEAEPLLPPKGFFAFVSACTDGLRGYIGGLALLSAAISAYEAFLFLLLGRIVDWLGSVAPQRLWAEWGTTLLVLAAMLV